LRKIAASVLAVPVLALLYLPVLASKRIAARLALVLGVGGLLGLAGFGILPRAIVAVPASTPAAVEAQRFGPAVVASQPLDGTILIEFSKQMDRASVEAALSVDPAAETSLLWLDSDQAVLIGPKSHWAPGTFYTLAIDASARDVDGGSMAGTLRTAFSTRPATGAAIIATEMAGKRVRSETAFVVTFDTDVPVEAAKAAFAIEPAVAGELLADDVGSDAATTRDLTFLPDEPLAPDTRYAVSIRDGLVDAEGAPVAVPRALSVRTTAVPAVARFRPRNGTEEVDRDADLSVRFTRKMDRASTEKAFAATVNGHRVAGSLQWFENDTVLLLDPKGNLPYGAKVTLKVAASARSVDGVALDRSRSVSFTTVPKPKATPRPAAAPRAKPTAKPTPRPSGGGGAGRASWYAVERYMLKLMNCTRGGGWVESNGSCSSPGGSGIAPLRLHAGISDRVARPYARRLATAGACTHFLGGTTIGSRLKASGYYGAAYGENISCRYYADPMDAAVAFARFTQAERSWNGGHWANLMNPRLHYVGIGLWITGGHLNLVMDFFTPR
jgi:uncharacterized protein YkwD